MKPIHKNRSSLISRRSDNNKENSREGEKQKKKEAKESKNPRTKENQRKNDLFTTSEFPQSKPKGKRNKFVFLINSFIDQRLKNRMRAV